MLRIISVTLASAILVFCGAPAKADPPTAVDDSYSRDARRSSAATGGWNQNFYEPSPSSTTSLSNGGVAFAWRTSAGEIRVLTRDRLGNQTAPEFVVSATSSGNPSIAGLTGGGFVVTWAGTDPSGIGTAPDIVARRYDAALNAAGPAFRVNNATAGDQTVPHAAGLAGGGFAIAWTTASEYQARFYDATGLAVTGEVILNTSAITGTSFFDARALDDGGVVFAWASGTQMRTRAYSASGAFLTPERSFTSASTPVDMALLDGGGVAFVSQFDGDFFRYLRLEMWNARGAQTVPLTVFGPRTTFPSFFNQVTLDAVDDGGFVMSAAVYQPGRFSMGSWSAALYDQTGTSIASIPTAGSTVVESFTPNTIALEDGRFLIVYPMNVPGSPVPIIYREAMLYEPRPLSAEEVHSLNVTVNDRDGDGDALTITQIAGQPPGGGVTLPSGGVAFLSNNTLVYTATSAAFATALANGEAGADSFSYTITDGTATDTATVNITLVGVGDAPTANNDTLTFTENEAARDVRATLLANDTDPDTGETAQLTVSTVNTAGTLGQVVYTPTSVTYAPGAAFEALPAGQTGSDSFGYTVSDPDGLTDTATVSVTINGENDAPVAANDAVTFSEEEGARNITFALLTNDTDVDTGEADQLAITAVDTTGTQGVVDLTNGQVHYVPNGAFNTLAEGQSATDSFTYTITDPGGLTSTATVMVTINGFDGYMLTAAVEGLGSGTVSNLNLAINCGTGGSACSNTFEQNTDVELFATPASGSRFDGWSGACTGTGQCLVPMTMAQSVTARFEIDTPPDGRIVAATLPGARSSYVGGPSLTAYMTVISRATTPAQDCRISATAGAPFSFGYQALDGGNQPTGPADPRFDLGNGQSMGFVLVMTPQSATGASGYTFQPQIACDNAVLASIPGVNSVLVSIGNAPVPDILSISATHSGDGVVRIPSSGNRISFMSAAAMNIGAGDGSAGAGEATVTVSVDTGGATLPVTLEVCETNAGGSCTTPRGQASLSTVFSGSTAKTFAVFVRANEGGFVPFDPANARVYLRFTDATGTLRSVTSAAIAAPAG